MSIKHVIIGATIVAGGFLATSGVAADMQLQKPHLDSHKIQATRLEAASTLNLEQARKLINQRVSNRAKQRELNSIASKIQKLKSPELVGAWGLGCGAGCRPGRDFTRMSVNQRAAAISASRISPADRSLLLDINKSMGELAQKPGSLVGAWGLGCGGSCSRPAADFGQRVDR